MLSYLSFFRKGVHFTEKDHFGNPEYLHDSFVLLKLCLDSA